MECKIVADSLGLCPCGKRIYGSVLEEVVVVIHEAPLCDAFLSMEPTAFLPYVRRFRGIPDEETRLNPEI